MKWIFGEGIEDLMGADETGGLTGELVGGADGVAGAANNVSL